MPRFFLHVEIKGITLYWRDGALVASRDYASRYDAAEIEVQRQRAEAHLLTTAPQGFTVAVTEEDNPSPAPTGLLRVVGVIEVPFTVDLEMLPDETHEQAEARAKKLASDGEEPLFPRRMDLNGLKYAEVRIDDSEVING